MNSNTTKIMTGLMNGYRLSPTETKRLAKVLAIGYEKTHPDVTPQIGGKAAHELIVSLAQFLNEVA